MRTEKREDFNRRFLFWGCTAGLLLCAAVFAVTLHMTKRSWQTRLVATVDFIKEQSASYSKYNDTALAKSLVREATAARQLTLRDEDDLQGKLGIMRRSCG